MEQTTMFDQAQARDEAIAAVESHSVVWRTEAERALRAAAAAYWNLTSDDVWALLRVEGISAPPEPRAMGPVMMAGVRKGWIEPTDQVRTGSHSPNHKRPQRVYRSRIR